MPLFYDMPLYRPPSEGNNLIIQATLGCSFNHCTFFSMYKSKDYVERPLEAVFADIEAAARDWPGAHRVFLADGDALALPTESLIAILDKLAETFPALNRVSAYATPKNLTDKSVDDLAQLKSKKLSLVYLGIESGANAILKRIIKGATQKIFIRALSNAREAGLKVSATVILGLGSADHWEEHAAETAALVNAEPPTYLSTLQLHVEPDAYDEFMEAQRGPFRFQDDEAILAEQERLISLINPPRPIIFRSNHASNCLALAGNLPKDRDKLLAQIAWARDNRAALRPDHLRAL